MTTDGPIYYPLPKEKVYNKPKPERPMVRRVIVEYNNMEMETFDVFEASYASDILKVMRVILS